MKAVIKSHPDLPAILALHGTMPGSIIKMHGDTVDIPTPEDMAHGRTDLHNWASARNAAQLWGRDTEFAMRLADFESTLSVPDGVVVS